MLIRNTVPKKKKYNTQGAGFPSACADAPDPANVLGFGDVRGVLLEKKRLKGPKGGVRSSPSWRGEKAQVPALRMGTPCPLVSLGVPLCPLVTLSVPWCPSVSLGGPSVSCNAL